MSKWHDFFPKLTNAEWLALARAPFTASQRRILDVLIVKTRGTPGKEYGEDYDTSDFGRETCEVFVADIVRDTRARQGGFTFKETGLHRETVREEMQRLIAAGVVRCDRRPTKSRPGGYAVILDPETWRVDLLRDHSKRAAKANDTVSRLSNVKCAEDGQRTNDTVSRLVGNTVPGLSNRENDTVSRLQQDLKHLRPEHLSPLRDSTSTQSADRISHDEIQEPAKVLPDHERWGDCKALALLEDSVDDGEPWKSIGWSTLYGLGEAVCREACLAAPHCVCDDRRALCSMAINRQLVDMERKIRSGKVKGTPGEYVRRRLANLRAPASILGRDNLARLHCRDDVVCEVAS